MCGNFLQSRLERNTQGIHNSGTKKETADLPLKFWFTLCSSPCFCEHWVSWCQACSIAPTERRDTALFAASSQPWAMSTPGLLPTLPLLQSGGSQAQGGTGVSREKNSVCKGQNPAEHDELEGTAVLVPQLPHMVLKDFSRNAIKFLIRTGLKSAAQLWGLPHPTSGLLLPASPTVCSTNYISVTQ